MASGAEPPPFQESANCFFCNCTFTTFRRRHHCRCCGKTVCADHSSHSKSLPQFGLNFPVRVCEDCYGQPTASSSSQHFSDPLGVSASRGTATSSDHSKVISDNSEDSSGGGTRSSRKQEASDFEAATFDPSPESLEPAVECKCGMPLCICEAPSVVQERTPPTIPSSPEPLVRESQPKRVPGPGLTSSSPGNGLPSLFFTGGNTKSPSVSQKRTQEYETTGEGLREAVRNGDSSAVKRLLEQGVSPHYVDRQGMPLLHLAAVFNQTEIVFILMDAGANSESRSAQGETAFDCAPATLAHKMKQKLHIS